MQPPPLPPVPVEDSGGVYVVTVLQGGIDYYLQTLLSPGGITPGGPSHLEGLGGPLGNCRAPSQRVYTWPPGELRPP